MNHPAALGIAGIDTLPMAQRSVITHPTNLEPGLTKLLSDHTRMGDKAAVSAWKNGVWFADFTYLVKKTKDGVAWRVGRRELFARGRRVLPLILDSAGYRREISRNAPQWAHDFRRYIQAIELIQPDGFAAWDYPMNRDRSIDYGHRMYTTFGTDDKLWPVFSIRWSWSDKSNWGVSPIIDAYPIPITKTQRPFNPMTRQVWSEKAIANARRTAHDPLFIRLAEDYGRVMIGGMVNGPCPRMVRHIYIGELLRLFPDLHIWGLGQASNVVVNGLGSIGALDRTWVDGSWWIKDAVAERFAIVDRGLITMLNLGNGNHDIESFFTLPEMMAANLRSLLAAYEGLIEWPELDWPETAYQKLDQVYASDLVTHYKHAQLALGL